MSIIDRFKPQYRDVEGGLFSQVEKADVGDGAIRLKEQGVDLLCWADAFFPDPATPDFIKKAACKAIEEGRDLHYTMPIGSSTLKEKIGEKLKRKGYHLDPQRNILITPGSDSGLFFSMFPFIKEGDEIMVHDPCYPNNLQNVKLMGAHCVSIPLKRTDRYEIDVAEFQKRLTDKTKMVVLTNPNNPTTTVFTHEELRKLSAFIVENDLVLVVDQAFEDIVYEKEMVEIALMPGMWERTLVVCSTSKGMGMSGYRVAYIVACDEIMDKLYGSAVTVIGATNTLAQIVAEEAFADDSFIAEYKEIFDRRRKYVFEKLNAVPHVQMDMPESSFLAWVDVSRLGDTQEVVDYLVKEAKCLVNNGINYGRGGKGFLRIVFGALKEDQDLFGAIDRMAEALCKFQEK